MLNPACFSDNVLADAYRAIWKYGLIKAVFLPILGVDRYCKTAWITRASARTAWAYDAIDQRKGAND